MEKYCGRPPDFEARILRSHAAIPHDHILICMGDVCMGKDAAMHATWVNKIPCRKWLIIGNHDRQGRDWYLSHGWEFVSEIPMRFRVGKEWVWLSHEPMPISELGGLKNLHGHCHLGEFRETPDDDSHILISMEKSNYAPFVLDERILKI